MQLAELWPEGWMDNNGIKAAVFRAKERKKRLSKLNKVNSLYPIYIHGFNCSLCSCFKLITSLYSK